MEKFIKVRDQWENEIYLNKKEIIFFQQQGQYVYVETTVHNNGGGFNLKEQLSYIIYELK